jgi:hypothetical protein
MGTLAHSKKRPSAKLAARRALCSGAAKGAERVKLAQLLLLAAGAAALGAQASVEAVCACAVCARPFAAGA